MKEQYPWNQRYTKALNTGVRIGKVILLAEATARATLRRAHDVARRLLQRMRPRQRSSEFDDPMFQDTDISRSGGK